MNLLLLSYELDRAGLPVVGVASTGRIDYSRELSEPEAELANKIISQHDPSGVLPVGRAHEISQLLNTIKRDIAKFDGPSKPILNGIAEILERLNA